MKIGYARVSTQDQDLGRQIAALQQAGCEMIFEEKISGAKSSRPELDKMIAMLKTNDTVVVLKLDRLGRSSIHIHRLIEMFRDNKINFISLGDNFDLTTPMGRFGLQLIGSIAELEREMIVERTKHGLAYAKSQGRVGGRPKVDRGLILTLSERGQTNSEIAKNMNISTKTVGRVINEFLTS